MRQNKKDYIFTSSPICKILELEREALYRIEAETGHELGITEDVQHEISLLGTNIWYADRGEYDKIKDERHLKHDPVEWTARWEEVIDEAEAKAYTRLQEHPQGMGFVMPIGRRYLLFWPKTTISSGVARPK